MVTQFSVSVLSPEVLVEDVGDDCLVYVPGTESVVTLSGDTANALRRIQSGLAVDPTSSSVSELIRLGIVQASSPMSRRNVIRAGLIGAGAGVAALSLPSVAAASSAPGGATNNSGDSASLLSFNTGLAPNGEIVLIEFKVGLPGLNADFTKSATVTLSGGTTITMAGGTYTAPVAGGPTFDAFVSGNISTQEIPVSSWYSLTHTIAFTTLDNESATATFTLPDAPPPQPPQ